MNRTRSLGSAAIALVVAILIGLLAAPASAASYDQMENRERPWFSGPVCLEIDGASKVDGGRGEVEWCSYNSIQQQWEAVPVPDLPGHYYLKNFHSGRCLEVSGASFADGAATVQQGCSTYRAQQHWKLVQVGSSQWYEVVNRNSGKCLTNSGWRALQYNCDGATKQHWTRPI